MRAIFSIFLSTLVLVSTLGLALDTHICQGSVYATNVSIGGTPLGCGMEDESLENSDFSGQTVLNKSCCSNNHYDFQVSEDYNSPTGQKTPDVSVCSLPILEAQIQTAVCHFEEYQTVKNHGPPHYLTDDFNALLQTYLI